MGFVQQEKTNLTTGQSRKTNRKKEKRLPTNAIANAGLRDR